MIVIHVPKSFASQREFLFCRAFFFSAIVVIAEFKVLEIALKDSPFLTFNKSSIVLWQSLTFMSVKTCDCSEACEVSMDPCISFFF